MKTETRMASMSLTNLDHHLVAEKEISMRNSPTTIQKRTSNRLLQNATMSFAIMELLLACTSVDRTTMAEDSRKVAEGSSQMVEDVNYPPNQPLPNCNARDNRDDAEENDCIDVDNDVNAIVFKVATKAAGGVEKGETFFCQCGNVELETREDPVPGSLDELESIAIASQNSTCLVWSRVGGKKECVVEVP